MTSLKRTDPRYRGKILVALMLLGLILRFHAIRLDTLTYPDSTRYLHLAQEMNSGKWFSANLDLFEGFMDSRRLAPLYSLLVSPFAATTDKLLIAGTMISILASVLTFIPLFVIGERLFSEEAALFACSLWAIHPFVLNYSGQVLTEPLFCLLFLSVTALIVLAFEEPSFKVLAASGAASALLYTTREAGISAICVTLFALACKWHLFDKEEVQIIVKRLIIPLVVFLIFVTPFLLHLRIRLGHWAITGRFSKIGITRVVRAVGSTIDGKNSVRGRNAKVISGSSFAVARAFVKKVVSNFFAYGTALCSELGLLLTLLCIASIGTLWQPEKKNLLSVGLMTLLICQLLLLYAIATPCMLDARYVYPLVPICFLLASAGCFFVQKLIAQPTPRGVLAISFLVVFVVNLPSIAKVFDIYSEATT